MNKTVPSPYRIAGHALELLFVLITGFGWFIWSSTRSALNGPAVSIRLSDKSLYSLIAYELFALCLIACVLRWRKWALQDFSLSFHPRMFLSALLLIAIRLVLGLSACTLLIALFPELSQNLFAALDAGWLSIILVIVINSLYEEALLVGYVFKRFEGLNPVVPFLISMLIRLSYHTYQGWSHMPMILAMAVVFGIYYIRYRKLWPLILAHGLGNAFSFMSLRYHWLGI